MFSALNIRYYSVKSKNGIISFIVSIIIFFSHSALLILFWYLIRQCTYKERLLKEHNRLEKNELNELSCKIVEEEKEN